MMLKVSVIVPVYNAGGYIIPCIESLVSQTLDDIEIIFVDDHGQDDSISKIQAFASNYKGPKSFVFTSTIQNSGPGEARNAGIKCAKGEYIAFVDSDDTVDPDFCRILYQMAVEQSSDLACCDIQIGPAIKRNPDANDKKFFLKHFVSFFTTFIYKRDLLNKNGILFPASSSAEDTCFLTCCILSANKIVQIHKPMYHYQLHDTSTSRAKNRRRAFGRMSSIRQIISFARRHGYYKEYRHELCLLLIKKGYGMAIKDLISG